MSIIPYLSVKNADDALEFYKAAFGAELIGPTLRDPAGNIVHTEIKIGESILMMADENPDFGNISPSTLGNTSVKFSIETDDADGLASRAIDAGAELVIPVADQFYGYRSGRLKDPFGHIWILSQKLEDLTEAEMQKRCNEMFNS